MDLLWDLVIKINWHMANDNVHNINNNNRSYIDIDNEFFCMIMVMIMFYSVDFTLCH